MGFNRLVVRIVTKSATSQIALFLVLSLGIAACARGSDVVPRGNDGSGPDGGSSDRDAEAGVCDPPCGVGERCEAGSCVPSADADGDGIDASVDCDDDDDTVGSFAEHDCEGACGPGLTRCEDGVWGACSAPTTCDCEPGEAPRTLPCGACGTQRQTCVDGTWQNDGGCMGEGACSPGDIDTGGSCGNCGMQRRSCDATCTWGAWACEGEGVCAIGAVDEEMQSCGGCGGTQARQRTCDGACQWGAWGAFGACTGGTGGECTAGMTETRTTACGNCGTQMQERTCSSGCTWGSWTNVGGCTGEGVCAPGARSACSPADSCGERVCTSACGWGSCQPVAGAECLHMGGTNYRTCTLSGGGTGRQYCLPPLYDCQWSDQCAP